MPRKELIDRERREDPQFNDQVRAAIVEARRRRTNRHRLAKLSRNAAWTTAEGAVPRSIDPDLRGDVVGELSLAICTGEVGVGDDLQAAWKKFRTQLTRNRWKESSLDVVISGTENLRWIDLLSSDAEHV